MANIKQYRDGNLIPAVQTMSTQGLVEADRWKAVLRELDEHLCDIIGYEVEEKVSTRMASYALTKLREAYPVKDQLLDRGFAGD